MSVRCPKCHGGCDLCGGAGQVPEGAARAYLREESRATVKIPPRQMTGLRWPEEPPTKPDTPSFIRRARATSRAAAWALTITGALALGILIALIARLLTR